MAKTYNTFTNVATGDVYTAAAHNNILTNLGNYRVPPAIQLVRTTAINPYTSNASISWSSATFDTESPSDPMWSSGSDVTIRTSGLYLVMLSLDMRTTSTMTGNCYVNLTIGGTGTAYSLFPATSNPRVVASFILSLSATNVLAARVEFGGGGTVQINGAASGADQSRLNITWLGQVS